MFWKLLRLPSGWLPSGWLPAAGAVAVDAVENRGAPAEVGGPNTVATGNFERAANALNENEFASIVSVSLVAEDGSELGAPCLGSTVGVVAGEISSYFGKVEVNFWSSGLLGTCCGAIGAACLVASVG